MATCALCIEGYGELKERLYKGSIDIVRNSIERA